MFDSSVPLGGVEPVDDVIEAGGPVRHLVLAMILLAAAISSAWASTLPWLDQVWHRPGGDVVTGWTRIDGMIGRGWVTMTLAVLVAGSGLLIALSKQRSGRVLAVTSGVGLMVLATIEWGVAGTSDLDGPGKGLWAQLIIGALVVLSVGIVPPLVERNSS